MAEQLNHFTEHHVPPCSAHISLPITHTVHTHTNNSLQFSSLADGDSAARIKKTPVIRDIFNVIT